MLDAAASVRLCVETFALYWNLPRSDAAASVRLCVETLLEFAACSLYQQPPPCGCVLKQNLQ